MAGMKPRVAVIQFPGVNCEWETADVLRSVGLEAVVLRWNLPPGEIAGHDAYVLPGGFSYQDRVRAGAISAREPVMETLTEAAANGVPILGICNGAQVLVEAGLVPGDADGAVKVALARNQMPGRSGYYSRWVELETTNVVCAFTRGVPAGTRIPMPMAHGEGRFTSADPDVRGGLEQGTSVPFRYADADGAARGFPANPNGAVGAAAGVVGGSGNVLALMPHPERSAWLWQVPQSHPGAWGERRRAWSADDGDMATAGPGRIPFEALARTLTEA